MVAELLPELEEINNRFLASLRALDCSFASDVLSDARNRVAGQQTFLRNFVLRHADLSSGMSILGVLHSALGGIIRVCEEDLVTAHNPTLALKLQETNVDVLEADTRSIVASLPGGGDPRQALAHFRRKTRPEAMRILNWALAELAKERQAHAALAQRDAAADARVVAMMKAATGPSSGPFSAPRNQALAAIPHDPWQRYATACRREGLCIDHQRGLVLLPDGRRPAGHDRPCPRGHACKNKHANPESRLLREHGLSKRT